MHAKFLMKKLIFSPHFVHLRGFHSRAYRIILCFNSKRDGTLETSVKKVSAGEKKCRKYLVVSRKFRIFVCEKKLLHVDKKLLHVRSARRVSPTGRRGNS